MTVLLAAWLAVSAALVFWRWHLSRGVGLTVAFVISLSSLHFLAATLYLLPWHAGMDRDYIQSGLLIALQGLLGVAVGAMVMTRVTQREADDFPDTSSPQIQPGLLYIALGLTLYTIVRARVGNIPSVGAVAAGGSSLVVFGLCLLCWQAPGRRQVLMLAMSAVLPFVTILTQGYLSYGIAALVVVFVFVAEHARPRWMLIVASVVFGYVTMSFYVTYMRDRNDIRDVVWNGASPTDRMNVVARTLQTIEPFDPRNSAHLSRVDDRLNQDYLVGRAEAWLSQRYVPFGGGDTVSDALLALVPRVIWRDKPMSAGSGDLVSRYTGMQFGPDTSVGIGQVMEWYVNFGTWGVWAGMAALGALVVLVDNRAGFHLAHGEVSRCCLWFVPGLSLLQVGGSLVDVSLTAGAGIGVALLANWVVSWVVRIRSSHALLLAPTPAAEPLEGEAH